jgi:PAS domain S-box-containing protein
VTEPKEEPARPGLRQLIEATAGLSGQRFFDALCQVISGVCGARVGLIAGVEGAALVPIARFEPRHAERGDRIPLRSPWAEALASPGLTCDRGARTRFPGDPWLARAQAEGLIAVPILARGGGALGLVAVMHPEPLAEPARAHSLLGLAALRAAAELERSGWASAKTPAPVPERSPQADAGGQAPSPEDALADAIPDAILQVDASGRIVAANRTARALFGLPERGAVERTLLDLLPRLPESEAGEFPLEATRGDGSRFEARIAVRPHGELRLVRIRDASPERAREAHLRSYAEVLERANRDLDLAREAAEQTGEAKTQFLANMSHEIRTPLTAILGFADILLAEPGTRGEDFDRDEALRAIQRNGAYLLQVINEILHFSKLDAGEARAELSDCSLLLLLSEIRSLFAFQARERGLDLWVQLDGAVPETFRSDPIFLRQALVNLVGNAIKFTERGRVEVTARYLSGPHVVEVEVADTGMGISREDLHRIFEPFQQVDGSRARRFGGTGLGLAIARRLIEALGGRIQVESELGQGSRFRVAVPAPLEIESTSFISEFEDPATETENTLREVLAAVELDLRVLVVEDGPDNQRVLRHILRKAGCQVEVANNGAEGLEFARKEPPFDVILMDIQMPVLDGLEATRQLRASGYRGRIIALTAHAFDAERERALRAGCDDFATKPIDRLELLKLIQRG